MGKLPPPHKALRRQLRDLRRASGDINPTTAGEISLADLDKTLAVTDLATRPPGNEELANLSLENQVDRSLYDADRATKNDSGSMPDVHSSFTHLTVQLNAL